MLTFTERKLAKTPPSSPHLNQRRLALQQAKGQASAAERDVERLNEEVEEKSAELERELHDELRAAYYKLW